MSCFCATPERYSDVGITSVLKEENAGKVNLAEENKKMALQVVPPPANELGKEEFSGLVQAVACATLA